MKLSGITKREKIKLKYGGLCAYTGKPLDDKWQVDHITPLWHFDVYRNKYPIDMDINHESNLLPCLRIVNHYKREKNLESFRAYMYTFHERLAKLPKNPRTEKTIKRIAYMMEIANAFHITVDQPFSGVFYFETINE